MIEIAGHHFHSLTPGEFCQRENCEGVASLVELCALAPVACVNDPRIAHAGLLSSREHSEMIDAAKQLRELMEKVFP